MVIYNWSGNGSTWFNMAFVLETREEIGMKIVVKKVPKYFRGIVKLIFGFKD